MPRPLTNRLLYILLACLFIAAIFAYYNHRERALRSRISTLEEELRKAQEDCETRVAMLKAEVPDDSCSRLEGKALTDFIAQLPPQTITRFVEEYRRRSAMVRGYELPAGCAEMLPAECFRKKGKWDRKARTVREKGLDNKDVPSAEAEKTGPDRGSAE